MTEAAKKAEAEQVSIQAVTPQLVPTLVDRIVPLLQKVVKPQTGYSIDGVLNDLCFGHTQLWAINDFQAMTITRIQHRDTEKVLWNEWLAGADMDEWVDQWGVFQEQYARAQGCGAIEFAGRIGYKRKYMPYHRNFRAVRTLYRQEL